MIFIIYTSHNYPQINEVTQSGYSSKILKQLWNLIKSQSQVLCLLSSFTEVLEGDDVNQ